MFRIIIFICRTFYLFLSFIYNGYAKRSVRMMALSSFRELRALENP